jgi:hypothetical protein
MAWQFVLTDLLGNVHGELTRASSRKVSLPHLRIPNASCTIPIWHPLAPLATDTDCLLKCYRTDAVTGQKDLAFHGPIVSAEENSDGASQTIALTAAGPYWRMTKRIIPGSKLKAGLQYGSSGGPLDLGSISRSIITDVNGADFTGIDLGTQTATTSGWVGKWWLKNAAEAIAELSAGLNTFEFRVRPTEPVAYANPNNWPRIGLYDVAPTIGQSRPDAIFEYGTSRANVAGYSRSISRDSLLTSAIISVQGWPDSVEQVTLPATGDKYNLLQRAGGATITAPTAPTSTDISSRGLFEEVVGDNGVLDDTLRAQMADFHVLIRKQPRQQITFKPSPNARPAPFVDYNPGDTVRARAVVNGTLRFDALFRIWGITFDVDENGNENVELELVTP